MNEIYFKEECLHSLSEYVLEGCKNCSEKNGKNFGVNYSYRSENHEIAMVEQPKLDLSRFDDERCFFNKNEILQELHSENGD